MLAVFVSPLLISRGFACEVAWANYIRSILIVGEMFKFDTMPNSPFFLGVRAQEFRWEGTKIGGRCDWSLDICCIFSTGGYQPGRSLHKIMLLVSHPITDLLRGTTTFRDLRNKAERKPDYHDESFSVCGVCAVELLPGSTAEYCFACLLRDAFAGTNYLVE